MKHAFDFAITTYCQAKCRSCARTNESTGEAQDWLKLKHMDFDMFKRVLETANIEFDFIQFCGELGDPCMHPQVEEFTDFALLHAPYVHINTNGGLRAPAWYKRVAEQYGDRLRIKFGVDGTDHDTNWLYREGVNFKRAMDNMRAFYHAGGVGKWHFLLFDWNWHQIPEAVDIAKNDLKCEIEFKWNNRGYGKIQPHHRSMAQELLDKFHTNDSENYEDLGYNG